MRLLINISNNLGGGGLQVALSFISECKNFTENKYIIVLNKRIAHFVNISEFDEKLFFFEVVDVKNFVSLSQEMTRIEKHSAPDVVFTVFGPSYWKPKHPHIEGYAIPHHIYSESPFWKIIGIKDKSALLIKKIVHFYFFKRDADAIVCETEDAMDRIKKNLKKPNIEYFTVSNTCSAYFKEFTECKVKKLPDKTNNEYRFILVSKYYHHKNFEIIPEIISELLKQNVINVRFVLTLSDNEYKQIIPLKYRKYVYNLGLVKMEECPGVYSECDAIIQPSLLEVFSANYVEAMCMKKPIIASDMTFAHTICGDAALYYEPLNAYDAAIKIQKLVNNSELQQNLVSEGDKQFKKYYSARKRAELYLSIASKMIGTKFTDKEE